MRKEAMLYEKLDGGSVECFLCSHRCRIKEGKFGFCRVRQNQKGTLRSLVYAKAIAAGVDPIEKKPLYHFFPGSLSYSVATVGCNFRCNFCQNWQISQACQNVSGRFPGQKLEPAGIVEQALRNNCRSISYTYTEPTVFFEYAYDTAVLAKKKGLYNNFVTNGYMAKKALDKISPYLDAANIDLKSFRDDFYRKVCRARLQPVLDSINYMKELGIWVEVTTLVVPGQNDTREELTRIAEFIASLDNDIPWHISRFHPDYKEVKACPTSLETLKQAYNIAKKTGLNYVYLGNVEADNNTYCSKCKKKVIERVHFSVNRVNIEGKKCVFCKDTIKGFFA